MSIPADCVSLADYERHFWARVEPGIGAYLSGAAADGLTERANRNALDALSLMPRALADLSAASTRCRLLGHDLPCPVLIAPMAYHRLAHDLGEVATARAAALTGIPFCVSTQASTRLEDVAAVSAAEEGPLWFQLYAQFRWDDTLSLVRRAEAAGYAALVFTVDAPINGIRNQEQRAGFRLPPGIGPVNLVGHAPLDLPAQKPGSPVFQGLVRHAATWDDVARLCAATRLPVLLKGILNPDDVDPALAAGATGIIVSNHGGRTLDGLPATARMLPLVAERVAGRVPVLMDGGIRRGTDIVKALALGAQAVLVGRPILHALAVGGMAGVVHALTLLHTELEAAMALLGRATVQDIDRACVFRSP